MEIVKRLKARRWATAAGYLFFVAMMATGYGYNLTFVQLGLVDLGGRVLGLSDADVARHMAALALLTAVVAAACGLLMQRRGWGRRFVFKLRLAFAVVLVQTGLTAAGPFVRSEAQFLAWIVLCSAALGVGVPATFSLAVDLIPRRDRGYVAALVTALAYFLAASFAFPWRIERFALLLLGPMIAGALVLGLLAFGRFAFVQQLAQQHTLAAFAWGRYVRRDAAGRARANRRLIALIVLMFGIYFVDSLGFLRLIATPAYMDTAWGSPELGVRLFIGVVHVIAALAAGVLYTGLGVRALILWVFGVFGLAHLMYFFDARLALGAAPLVMPMLYAVAVSLYTVVNFAVWADVSTPDTIPLHSALGVALSGWLATFLSTALALQWQAAGMELEPHLRAVDALALLFFAGLLVLALASGGERTPRAQEESA